MQINKDLARFLYGKRLPTWDGVISHAGTKDVIRINRDIHGIPTVNATNQHDAWFGLGFCQAQDRAFQLEVFKRQAGGTLSALFGSQTLSADRLARTIGFRRYAIRYLDFLDADEIEILQGFVGGVNFGLSKGFKKKPHEFEILKAAPTPYRERM